MQNVKVTYNLSPNGQKDTILQGLNGEKTQVCYIPFTKEIKDLVEVDDLGNLTYNLIKTYNENKLKTRIKKNDDLKIEYQYAERIYEEYYADKILSEFEVEELLIKTAQREKSLKEEFEGLEELCKNYNDEHYKTIEKHIIAEEEKKKNFYKEAEKWIKEYGSKHLQLLFLFDYCFEDLYAKERVNKEFPDFYIDFANIDKEFQLRKKAMPTLEELETLEEHLKYLKSKNIKDITLKTISFIPEDKKEHWIDATDNADTLLVVEGFLDKYRLVKVL